MEEVSRTGEVHGCASSLDCRDHVPIAHRAAWLHDSRHSGSQQDLRSVRKGEEGVGGGDGTRGAVTRPLHRQSAGVHAVDLPHANAY